MDSDLIKFLSDVSVGVIALIALLLVVRSNTTSEKDHDTVVTELVKLIASFQMQTEKHGQTMVALIDTSRLQTESLNTNSSAVAGISKSIADLVSELKVRAEADDKVIKDNKRALDDIFEKTKETHEGVGEIAKTVGALPEKLAERLAPLVSEIQSMYKRFDSVPDTVASAVRTSLQADFVRIESAFISALETIQEDIKDENIA